MLHSSPKGKPRRKTDRLAPSEYLPLAPKQAHTRVRVNHENCPAGTDRRKRLEIRNNGNRTLAYCHHCGRSGAYFHAVSHGYKSRRSMHEPLESVGKQYLDHPSRVCVGTPICRLDPETNDGAILIDAFLDKYNLDLGDLQRFPFSHTIAYDGRTKSIQICTDSLNQGKIEGSVSYQERYIGPGWETRKGPKYMTYGNKRVLYCQPSIHGISPRSKDTVVIVEDWISAVKVCSAGYTVICTFGSNPTDAQITDIATCMAMRVPAGSGVTRGMLVFYDDDNPKVREHSIELVQKLQLVLGSDKVSNVARGKDPKHFSYEDLTAIIEHRVGELYKEEERT